MANIVFERLNRTSVGLKRRDPPGRILSGAEGLNRTSVGLKRALEEPSPREASPRLNRTSVGLKRDTIFSFGGRGSCAASIEPAWD